LEEGSEKVEPKKYLAALSAVMATGLMGSTALAQSWTSQGPIARFGHSAVIDPSTKRMIVFGGSPVTSNEAEPLTDFNDLWIMTSAGGSNIGWLLIEPKGTKPAARLEHGAAYDPATNRMMLFGGGLGQASPCANDSWILTNANNISGTPAWTRLIPAWTRLIPAGTAPSPRLRFASAYDSSSNRLMVFAGNDCFHGFFNDSYILSHANGLGGTPTWSKLNPTGPLPSTRADVSGVYDPTSLKHF
jgi:hypothetical protein